MCYCVILFEYILERICLFPDKGESFDLLMVIVNGQWLVLILLGIGQACTVMLGSYNIIA